MAKNKKNREKKKQVKGGKSFFSKFSLPDEIKNYIFGIIFLLISLIFALSFFEKAGLAGKIVFSAFYFLVGNAIFVFPLIFVLSGLVFFFTKYQRIFSPLILAILLLTIGMVGVSHEGWLGRIFSWPLLRFFGFWVTQIVFGGTILISILIFWRLLTFRILSEENKLKLGKTETEKPLISRLVRRVVGTPDFKVREISPTLQMSEKETKIAKEPSELKKVAPSVFSASKLEYKLPPLDLLEKDQGQPSAGDIRQNSAIIKKTLENFGIPVEMSGINTGPTVTQYTLKPADGIKLAKITSLSNDLALSLASHPIRIEAPIPGKPLVGIEVPNKIRTSVRLRDLIANPLFQQSGSNLTIALGKDVSGNAVFADLGRMPHLLVAGSTGTGKTIFLNALITSLLYKNSPEFLRFILIDPKRVEFPVYNDLPHLLCPVILDAQKTVNVLKWLIGEMERRFESLAQIKARDIKGYNEIVVKTLESEPQTSDLEIMPFIILIVDELADLMAARGKEVEVGIVRLAQMARAVGIHLVVATQRPSVEVITGLIKANITSRVTFQVASQVDSRTVLDMAGAEKLLGMGDLLFVSAEITKPRRVQGAYVSDKEVRKIVNHIKDQNSKLETSKIDEEILENKLSQNLESSLEELEAGKTFESFSDQDPLYEEAKRVVIEARKASASLLQRKLRIGYARAARLIDILEERGVVGPSQGAKPREVYFEPEKKNEEGWEKI